MILLYRVASFGGGYLHPQRDKKKTKKSTTPKFNFLLLKISKDEIYHLKQKMGSQNQPLFPLVHKQK